MIYLAVLIGAVLYGLIDWINNIKAVLEKKYLLATLVNVVAGAVIVWATNLDQVEMMLGNFDASRIVGITLGIYGQKVFKMVVNKTYKVIESRVKKDQP